MTYTPKYTITDATAVALTAIERARGFLEAAKLSEDWIAGMEKRALVLEAHYTTHIEGTHLTLDQSGQILAGKSAPETDPDDARELLNYRDALGHALEHGRLRLQDYPALRPGTSRKPGHGVLEWHTRAC